MEHYRSTLAIAAAAAFGLFVAARVLHPGNFEDTPRGARPVVAQTTTQSAPTVTRLDPPFNLYMRPSASSSEMAVLAPRLTAPLPAGMGMMPILHAGITTVVDTTRAAPPQLQGRAIRHSVRAKPAMAARARTAQIALPDARSPRAGSPNVPTSDPTSDDEG